MKSYLILAYYFAPLAVEFTEKIKKLSIAILGPLFVVFLYEVVKACFNRLKGNTEYKAFLKEIDGSYFFCYNNRRATKEFIENEVLPKLDPRIEIIHVNGKVPVTSHDLKYFRPMLYGVSDTKGFPYLLKVEDGVVQDMSVNNATYIALQNPKQMVLLQKKINNFFNID